MRASWWIGLVVLLPAQALAAPDPPPPADYPGAQYIDRTGCVFVRQDDRWAPRLDKQGAPVCGFPPSPLATVSDAPVAPPSPEEALTQVLAEGLRPGDLLNSPAPEPLAPVADDPAEAALEETLADQVQIEARMRAVMTGAAPDGLCERLGYKPSDSPETGSLADVTQGLCPGMIAPELAPLAVAGSAAPTAGLASSVAVAAADGLRPPRPVAPVGAVTVARKAPPTAQQRTQPAKARSVIERRQAPTQDRPAPADVIPPQARYVQIGIYRDEANALAALRRLSGMGYRTAQRDESGQEGFGKAILAGPFADRQSLVQALTRLRANGYPLAAAR